MQNQTEIPDKWPDKWLEILTCTLLDCYICDNKNKEKQRKASKKKANERYQDLPGKNKKNNEKRQFGHGRYEKLPENEKQWLVEYSK